MDDHTAPCPDDMLVVFKQRMMVLLGFVVGALHADGVSDAEIRHSVDEALQQAGLPPGQLIQMMHDSLDALDKSDLAT